MPEGTVLFARLMLVFLPPREGTADVEIEIPSAEKPEPLNVLPDKSWSKSDDYFFLRLFLDGNMMMMMMVKYVTFFFLKCHFHKK